MPVTGAQGRGERSPADVLHALGHRVTGLRADDPPEWHLAAAEEAMNAGDWDMARAAIQRARESIIGGAPEADEASFAAVRLAVSTADLRAAEEEVASLAQRMDSLDPVWNRRVRKLVAEAVPGFPEPMRARLLQLLPPMQDSHAESPPPHDPQPYFEMVRVPPGGLPFLPDEGLAESSDRPGATGTVSIPEPGGLPPVPTEGPSAAAEPVWPSPGEELGREETVVQKEAPATPDPIRTHGLGGRHFVPANARGLEDADEAREQLVEEMLGRIREEEGELLFSTASTFLHNGQFETAEIVFSAAMQLPDLWVAACEGLMQALVGAGRYTEAVATGTRAERIFARNGEDLLGVVYWHGVAAQALGAGAAALTCYARVLADARRVHFPEVATRMAALR